MLRSPYSIVGAFLERVPKVWCLEPTKIWDPMKWAPFWGQPKLHNGTRRLNFLTRPLSNLLNAQTAVLPVNVQHKTCSWTQIDSMTAWLEQNQIKKFLFNPFILLTIFGHLYMKNSATKFINQMTFTKPLQLRLANWSIEISLCMHEVRISNPQFYFLMIMNKLGLCSKCSANPITVTPIWKW